ncbi:nuclear transport factor 2 family protein [Tenacibaculum xiamenense]|uniref:nuclear transport factor 2 family protein n=1 Tax=Tenacibaculum xiamenense TaxID=1261553 RepID=UPI0038952515
MYKENIREIESLIENYFEGIFYGEVKKLENCFYENTLIHGDIKGEAYLKKVSDYIDGVKNRKSPSELNETLMMKIIGVEVMGNIAMAKLHVPMLGYNYYDYLSLAKIDNHWKIVNKVFTHVA